MYKDGVTAFTSSRAPQVRIIKQEEFSSRQGQDSGREGAMAGSGMVFEPHDGAGGVGGGDVVFFVAILCLSVLSVIILAAAGASSDGQGKLRRQRSNGPVFVGGKGCGCGGCRAGAGVCGTYLS